MTRIAAALLAALLARAAAAAPPAGALPPGLAGDVELSADRVTYEPSTGRVLLDGNARLSRGAVVLRARSAQWDPATGEVRAAGGVLLTDPTRVIAADAVRAVLGGDTEAEGVLAFVKDQPVDLSAATTGAEAARAGRNRLSFSTPRLRAGADRHLRLSDARLTLCDCPGGAPPSWEVTASEADVVPGDRVILRWPVLRIAPPFASRTVPVLVVPWLYLPLGDRQSGLLVPTIGSTGASGFTLTQPLFLTLGRSADATLAPEYAFGRRGSDVAAGKPAVRGPGARLELRWAPAERAEGRVELAWLHDLDREPGGTAGGRGALVLTHAQRLGDATALHAAVRLAGDPVWVRDTTSDVLAQAVPYRRSDLLASRRGGDVVVEGVASYVQPLDPVAVGSGTPWDALGTPWGTLGAGKRVASRFGAAAATLLPAAAGPLRLSGRLGAARFAAPGAFASRGLDVAGRPAQTRADARAEVAVPLLAGGVVTFAPFLRGAALGYETASGRAGPAGVGWGIAGATLETEVSRRYGGLRHAVAPRLEWRAGTEAVSRGDPESARAYDLYDRSTVGLLSATPGVFQQLRASVETRLDAASATVLRVRAGQDLDLRAGRFAEAFAGLALAAGPATADASVRFFPVDGRGAGAPAPRIRSSLDELSELRAAVGLKDRRGDSVQAGFASVGPGGSGSLVAGLDPLFDLRPAPLDAAAVATLALRANLGAGASLGYDALLPGRDSFVPACSGTGERRVGALQVQQHAASLSWESPCRCFRVTMSARVNDCGGYGYSASIDLARLSGVAAGAAPR